MRAASTSPCSRTADAERALLVLGQARVAARLGQEQVDRIAQPARASPSGRGPLGRRGSSTASASASAPASPSGSMPSTSGLGRLLGLVILFGLVALGGHGRCVGLDNMIDACDLASKHRVGCRGGPRPGRRAGRRLGRLPAARAAACRQARRRARGRTGRGARAAARRRGGKYIALLYGSEPRWRRTRPAAARCTRWGASPAGRRRSTEPAPRPTPCWSSTPATCSSPPRAPGDKPPNAAEIERRARLLATGVRGASGTTAFTPGERDLALGVPLLRRLATEAHLPIVSANLRRPDGALLFEADRIVDSRRREGRASSA